MHTSWSADGLRYGWSYSNMVAPGFTSYVASKYPGSSPREHRLRRVQPDVDAW